MNRQQRRAGERTAERGGDSNWNGLANRLHLMEHNVHAAHLAWTQAGAHRDVVVIIADARDAIGAPLSRARLGVEGHEREVKRLLASGQRPTVVSAMLREDIAAGLVDLSPGIARQLASPPPDDHAYVVVSCSGGASLTSLPTVALPIAGDA